MCGGSCGGGGGGDNRGQDEALSLGSRIDFPEKLKTWWSNGIQGMDNLEQLFLFFSNEN